MKTLLIISLVVLGPLLAPTTAWSQKAVKPILKEEVKVDLWPAKLWNDISREVDRSGTQLNNIIFDKIDDFDLYGWSKNNNSAKVGVKRSVFDNQDVLNTYTVNDQFSIDLGRGATEFSIPQIPSLTTPINFNLGVGGKLVVNHMRQVFSNKYPELPLPEEIETDISKESEVLQKKQKKWWELDSSWRPRLGQFWNPLIALWRIPWTKEGLDKIHSGDLITYSASGYVSVGLEGGFVPLEFAPGANLSVGMGVQVFVKGEFRVTMLKESERYVRVKITKVKSMGEGLTIGSNTNEIHALDGMVIFQGKKLETSLPEQKITVIPFKIGIDRENKKQFDIGYRFDLSDPKAEEAFEKAMRGSLKLAEEVSKVSPTVTLILTRTSKEKRRSLSYQMGLSWLNNYTKSRERKDYEATIKKPDGTTEVFKSSLQLAKSWSTLWGSGEKQSFLFTTVFDKTAFEAQNKNSFQLVTEALYEDVNTSGKEMKKYLRDVQTVVGNHSVLPELPLLVPKARSTKLKIARYKRSSFYFGQYFTEFQVMKFLMTDPAKAKQISYQSFDYIKDEYEKVGRATTFFNHWMTLQQKFKIEMNAEEMVEALKELRQLFKYQMRAIHAMRALALSLDGEEIDYFITATNQSFGRVQFRGRATTNAEKLLQLADETVDFENKIGLYRPDLDAKIDDYKVEQLPDSRVKVSFTLPKDVKYLYFKVLRTSGWKKVKSLKDLIYVNKGRFKEGHNELFLGPYSTDSLDKALWSGLTTEDYYTQQMSASLDGKTWGRVQSMRFKFAPKVLKMPNFEELQKVILKTQKI